MSIDGIFQQVFNLAGTFSPMLLAALFLLCMIGEFGLPFAYLLETIWLVAGYNLGNGSLPFLDLLGLWVVAQLGRQAGALVLYYVGRLGSTPLMKLYDKYFGAKLSEKLSGNSSGVFGFLRRLNYLSPFPVALGRLFGLRIPLTLALGVRKRMGALSLGILLSSLVWDGIYVCLGAIVGVNVVLQPYQLILYSLAGLTLLYAVGFAFSRLRRLRISRHNAS
jgi:membrane protein DedA with SNARE-associated domain